MKDLFTKMLRGECTEAEIEQIITYLQGDSVDGDILGIDEVRALLGEGEQMDTGSANRIFHAVVDERQRRHDSRTPLRFIRKPPFMVAAGIALLLTIAGVFYFHEPQAIVRTAYGQVDSVRLADGTLVILKANTEVSWPKDLMGGRKREVWIDGEAYL